MKLTKILALILAVIMMALPLCSCLGNGKGSGDETTADKAKSSDLAYIQKKGTLVIGMTDYAPMNYPDENGEWIGFDTEFAYLVADELGIEVKFVPIVWDTRWFALETKDIDCVWNGMTLDETAKANADCTNPYVRNAQVVVVKESAKNTYTDASTLKDCTVAVEVASAGKGAAEAAGLKFVEYPAQSDALMAVESGKADACIIDITMANAMTGEGTGYEHLAPAFSLTEEVYAIGCRKGSDLTAKINEIMAGLMKDGSLRKLAEKYELTLVTEAE
ncbi:MAG: transporter substrate-binding domain-containing protein [Ruminococcaceae bacterium]|nr:transporter substrate-binding domain-containing protein [Oscillospiraceae bacterium]